MYIGTIVLNRQRCLDTFLIKTSFWTTPIIPYEAKPTLLEIEILVELHFYGVCNLFSEIKKVF